MPLEAGSVFVRLSARVDKSGFADYDKHTAKARAEAKRAIRQELGADFDERGFREYERAIRDKQRQDRAMKALKLDPEYDDRAFKAYIRDSGRAVRETNALGRASGRAGGGLIMMGSRIPLVKIGALGSALAYAATEVYGLVAALGPLAGLLGAIPSAITVGVQGLGGLLLSVGGVGDAIKEMAQSQDAASKDATASMDKQATAAEGVRTAQMAKADAERQAKYAREALTRAEAEAERQLQDLKLATLEADQAQRASVQTLREARAELARVEADPTATEDDVRNAELALGDAENTAKRARLEARRARQDNASAQRRGVRGSDQVVDARRAAEDAARGVTEAERGLAQATKEASKALAEQSSSAEGLATKMAHLSPAAQKFVHFIGGMRPEFDKLRAAGAEELFPRLTRGIQEASKNLPVLRGLVAGAGKEFGELAEKGGKMLGSAEWGKDMADQGRENEMVMGRLGDAGLHLANAFRHVMRSALPLTDWLSKATLQWSKNRAEQAEAGRENGKLAAFFERTVQVGRSVGRILENLAKTFVNVGRASNNSATGGERLLRSLEKGTRAMERWTRSAKGQKEIAKVFDDVNSAGRAVFRWLGSLITRYRELRKEGESAGDALAKVFGEQLGKALAAVASNLGHHIDNIILAFVKGFLASNVWGKLLIGGWLVNKLGGRGAVVGVGSKVAGWFMHGFNRGGGRGKLPGVPTGAPAGPGALPIPVGVPGPGDAPKQAGRLRGFFSKLGPIAKRAGFVGLGISALSGLSDAFGEKSAQASMSGKVDNFLRGATGGVFGKAKDYGKEVRDALRKVARGTEADVFRVAVKMGNFDPESRKLIQQLRRARKEAQRVFGRDVKIGVSARAGDFQKIEDTFDRLRKGTDSQLDQIRASADGNLRRISRSMDLHSKDGQKALSTNFRLSVRAVEEAMRNGTISSGKGMREIRRLLRTHSEGGKEAVQKNYAEMKRSIQRQMKAGVVSTEEGAKQIRKIFVEELKAYGFTPRQALNISKTGDPDANKGREGGALRARGGFIGRAVGGWIGARGQAGEDNVAVSKRPGTTVWNRWQTPVLDDALQAVGLGGVAGFVGSAAASLGGGGERALVGRGELMLEPEGTAIADRALAMAGYGGAGRVFSSITTPHYRRGGYVQGAVAPTGAAIRALASQLFSRGFSATSGGEYRGTGTFHDRQAALDFGNSVNNMASLWGVLFPRRREFDELFGPGFLPGAPAYRFGVPGGPVPGHEDHIHVAKTGGRAGQLGRGRNAGGGGGVAPQPSAPPWKKIRTPRVTGGSPWVRSSVRGALRTTTAAANRRGREAAEASGAGGGGGGGGGRYSGPLNRNFGRGSKVALSFNQVAKLAQRAGLPGVTFAQIAKGESSFQPGAVGNDPGGTTGLGLWQITTKFNDDIIRRFGGQDAMFNPWTNARAAKAVFGRQGIGAWYGTRYMTGTNLHYKGKQGGGVIGDFPGLPEGVQMRKGRRRGRRKFEMGALPKIKSVSAFGKKVRALAQRISGYPDLTGKVQRLGDDYTRQERRNNLTEEDLVVSPDEPGFDPKVAGGKAYIDQEALTQRVAEMDKLLRIRRRVVKVWDEYGSRVRIALRRVRVALRRLRGRRKTRKVRSTIASLVRTERGLVGRLSGIGRSREDAWLDFEELRTERNRLQPGAVHELKGLQETAGAGAADPDLEAQLAQSEERGAALREAVRLSAAAFNVFGGPGDIGAGGAYALDAVRNPWGTGGVGPGIGQRMDPLTGRVSPTAGAEGASGLPPGLYLARVDDVAGQREISKLSNAGNSAAGYRAATRERVGP